MGHRQSREPFAHRRSLRLRGARSKAILRRVDPTRATLLAFGFAISSWTLAHAESLERSASINDLFDASTARELARTLPADQPVLFHLRIPSSTARSGVLVFVSPQRSGQFREPWSAVFDQRNLVWVCAEDFGNDKPTAQRMLVAIMALKVAERETRVDAARTYVAGVSGGGRVASQTITHFPQRFAGALYIVGADFHMPQEPLRSQVLGKRFVFLTGRHDFNRMEMRRVFGRYQRAGVVSVKLMDLPDYGHVYPDAATLDAALEFLDAAVPNLLNRSP
jgi:predicted esterase